MDRPWPDGAAPHHLRELEACGLATLSTPEFKGRPAWTASRAPRPMRVRVTDRGRATSGMTLDVIRHVVTMEV